MTLDIQADSRRAESKGGRTVTLFVSLLATVAGASASLMICRLAGLSRHECVINTIAGALIIGGGVFSLLDHRRTHRNHDLEVKSILESAAFDVDLVAQRAIAEHAITELPVVPSPIFIMKITRRVQVTMKASFYRGCPKQRRFFNTSIGNHI